MLSLLPLSSLFSFIHSFMASHSFIHSWPLIHSFMASHSLIHSFIPLIHSFMTLPSAQDTWIYHNYHKSNWIYILAILYSPSEIDLGLFCAVFTDSEGKHLFHRIGWKGRIWQLCSFIHGAAIGARPVRRRQRVSLAREIRNLPQRQTGPLARPLYFIFIIIINILLLLILILIIHIFIMINILIIIRTVY